VELEFHQLDLRYERLRRRDPRRERLLVGSLSSLGQLLPIVVLGPDSGGRYVVVDGYKRVRALRRLREDTVRVTVWALSEPEALVLERMMRTGEREGALEQGWLLTELRERHGLSLEELAQRFDRSPSWVSRRLGLVGDLPETVQEKVRAGVLGAHAAMKYLVPLARAKPEDCERLVSLLSRGHVTSRQLGALYGGWLAGGESRALVLRDPWLYLRAGEESRRPEVDLQPPAATVRAALVSMRQAARRARHRLSPALVGLLGAAEREEIRLSGRAARQEAERLWKHLEEMLEDAGSEAT
jgi:ParB family chromosome partitioning protein